MSSAKSHAVPPLPPAGEPQPEQNPELAEKQEWYYKAIPGALIPHGPYTRSDVEKKFRKLDFVKTGFVRQGEQAAWIPVAESPFADLAARMPVQVISISDRWIWVMALLPLLLAAALLWLPAHVANYAYLAYPLVNLAILILDERELKRSGRGLMLEIWVLVGILVPPVYLLTRQIRSNHNFMPVILFCFLFLSTVLMI